MIDGTKSAVSGADVSQDEESGRAVRPALSPIGTSGALADGVEFFFPQNPGYGEEGFIGWKSDLEPFRFF